MIDKYLQEIIEESDSIVYNNKNYYGYEKISNAPTKKARKKNTHLMPKKKKRKK